MKKYVYGTDPFKKDDLSSNGKYLIVRRVANEKSQPETSSSRKRSKKGLPGKAEPTEDNSPYSED